MGETCQARTRLSRPLLRPGRGSADYGAMLAVVAALIALVLVLSACAVVLARRLRA
jgi:hypothetical protein